LGRGEVLGLVDHDVTIGLQGGGELEVGLELVEDEDVGRRRLERTPTAQP
jgi:hypothetical protein